MKNALIRLKRFLYLGVMLFIAYTPINSSAQSISETTLSILSYVRWTSEPPTVCIIDNKDATKQLKTLTNQNNYNFNFISIQASQLKKMHCHAVVFSNTTPNTEQQLINSSLNKNILSFSSNNIECDIGSAFCLYPSKTGGTRFKLNLDSLARSKLHVDPRVLLLARNAE